MKGFTLIELMIVVVIISLMTGLSVSRLIDFRDKRQVFSDAKFLVEELRRVRTKVTAVEVPAGCSVVQNYTMTLSSGGSINTTVGCGSGSPGGNYLESSLNGSEFGGGVDIVIVFDTYGRIGADTDVNVCRGEIGYQVSVSAEGVIGQPEELAGGCP